MTRAMSPSEVSARLRTPASRAEVEAGWARHLEWLELPARPVRWADTPRHALQVVTDGERDDSWHDRLTINRGPDLWPPPRVNARQVAFIRAVRASFAGRGLYAVWRAVYTEYSDRRRSLSAASSVCWNLLPWWSENAETPHWLALWSGIFAAWVLRREIICLPYPAVRQDQEGRVHAGAGPAVSWAGQETLWFWRGVRVPRWVVERPDQITAFVILGERNAEVRRAMIERLGAPRFLAESGGRVLDRDTDAGGVRELRRVAVSRGEWLSFLSVHCPSTGATHALGIPPHIRTCRRAVAWTFRMPPGEYAPVQET